MLFFNNARDFTCGHHQVVYTETRLFIICIQRGRSSIQSAKKKRPGDDCGLDYELLTAKFRLKLKKVEKPLEHSGMT